MPPKPTRVAPTGELPRPERGPWWEFYASTTGHIFLVMIVLALLSQSADDDPLEGTDPDVQQRPPEQIQLPAYTPPRPQPQRPQPPPPQPQQPQPARPVLPSEQRAEASQSPPRSDAPKEERPNAPPEERRQEGVREPDDAAAAPETPTRTPEPPARSVPGFSPREPSPKSEAVATQESEAQRLFGQKRRADATDDPITVRPFAVGPDGKPQKCDPLPRIPRDSTGKAPMGVAVGRILQDNGRPLGGALLQMIGTQYVAFTDENGEYRFTYDYSLVTDCRTQYVRVSKKGYESRLLVLVIGDRVRSEDVELRRSSGFPLNIRPGGR